MSLKGFLYIASTHDLLILNELTTMKESIRLLSAAAIFVALLTGCEDPILPTADFTFDPAEVKVNVEVAFTNASTDADTYAWDFGDGASSTVTNPTHTYTTAGTYTVKLTASNVDGSNELEKSIVVGDLVLPTVAFSCDPSEVTVYDTVAFVNSTTDADSYAWDFGEGTTSTDENPTHVFKTAGSYTVTLVATNGDGDAEAVKTVVVAEPDNYYQINDTIYAVDSTIFWYQSGMGGDPYLRLLTPVDGQDYPDLLKLFPNKGLNELPGTYSWEVKPMMGSNPVGTYDVGYTANYAGMGYDWTAIGKEGSGDLVITELDADVYKFEFEAILSLGAFDFGTGEFIETSTANIKLEYIGGVDPL